MLLWVINLFLNVSIDGADTTASNNMSQELMTRCEDLFVTGILFVIDFSTRLLCPLRCLNLVGRKGEDILGPKLFLSILHIKI